MTVEFFGVQGFGPLGGVNKNSRPGASGKTGKAEKSKNTDFSTALQGAGEMQSTGQAFDTQRAAKVQEIKEQVAAGTYEPDLNKVASSLLKFLVEEG